MPEKTGLKWGEVIATSIMQDAAFEKCNYRLEQLARTVEDN